MHLLQSNQALDILAAIMITNQRGSIDGGYRVVMEALKALRTHPDGPVLRQIEMCSEDNGIGYGSVEDDSGRCWLLSSSSLIVVANRGCNSQHNGG